MQLIENNPLFYAGRSVIIRTINPDDAALLYPWMQEKFFSFYKPYLKKICSTESLLAERIQMLASFEKAFEIEALVLHRASKTPIGLISISNIDTFNRKAEFSLAFHRGLGTRCIAETLGLLFHYAFFTLQLNKLYFYVGADNSRILKMVQHFDIVQEGKLHKEMMSDTGEWIDMYRFCILREGWTRSLLFNKLQRIYELLK